MFAGSVIIPRSAGAVKTKGNDGVGRDHQKSGSTGTSNQAGGPPVLFMLLGKQLLSPMRSRSMQPEQPGKYHHLASDQWPSIQPQSKRSAVLGHCSCSHGVVTQLHNRMMPLPR